MTNQSRRRILAASALLATGILCQCETVRTEGKIRSGGYSFDEKSWGGQGGGDDQKEIKSKFAERGYTIGEDGNIIADRPDLYADKQAKGFGKKLGLKEAKFANMSAKTKEFKTSEFMTRQASGISDARENGSVAREGSSSDRQAGKLFGTSSQDSSDRGLFQTKSNRNAGQVYETGSDRTVAAYKNAPAADGASQQAGFRDNVNMSMDDVKKMLNPRSYARHSGG